MRSTLKKRITFFIASVLAPLLLGSLFYIVHCPNVIFVTRLKLLMPWLEFPTVSVKGNSIIWIIVRNHLIDYIWAFSFSALILLIMDVFSLNYSRCVWLCVVLVIFAECIQLFVFIPFTFDILDLITQVLGAFSAIMVFNIFLKGRKTE